MRPWIEPPPVHVPPALAAAAGGHPLVAEMLARRGITDPAQAKAFLNPDLYASAPPDALPGMGRAVARITRALRAGEPICVWGDFDVDGQTSTALLVSVLRDLSGHVTYHVPNRETEGHGVELEALDQVIADGARLIVTCDTGIGAVEAVAHARRHRVDFVITDHHDLPERLPDAAAIVNPKLLSGERGPHALLHLPGVGVAYKLAEALYEWAGRGAEAEKHLDLAALGIIADVATLRGDTRYLAQRGLAALRAPRRLGLQVLLESAEVDPTNLTEEHIAFALAPRLNAAGRLADATQCVELLTTTNATTARIIAADLEALNAKRKGLTDLVTQQAEAQLVGDPALLDQAALVLASPYWPAGIIGIVASRLVERYGRPVVLISTAEGGPGRGSARSVEGIDISGAITACGELLLGFGGHPMAAGLTIEPERIPDLRAALSAHVAGQLEGRTETKAVEVDCVLPLPELSLELVADLGRLGPFGAGNPPLTLSAQRLEVKANRVVGRHEEHRILTVADESGFERQVVWWNGGSEAPPQGLFDLAYVARASTYRGERSAQVELLAWRTSAGEPEIVIAPLALEALDFRAERAPLSQLEKLLAEGGAVVFAEGEPVDGVPGRNRLKIEPAQTLVFWTTPSSPAEVRAALMGSGAERVVLFAIDPGLDKPDAFLRRLSGLVKHALNNRGGRVTLAELAAATAQREMVTMLGLRWLASNGSIYVVERPDGELMIWRADGRPAAQSERELAARRLAAALEETAAFRAYFKGAEKGALLRGYVT